MPKKQRIYNYFSEFASEALHIVIFENFVKSMTSCLSQLKVTHSFCFAFKIPDNVTATNTYYFLLILKRVLMGADFLTKIVKNCCPHLGFELASSRFVTSWQMAIEFFNRAAVKGGGAKGYCRVWVFWLLLSLLEMATLTSDLSISITP